MERALVIPTGAVHTRELMKHAADIVGLVARELGLEPGRVDAVARLLGEGATVPFIARYRKERTGEMDEALLRTVQATIEQVGVLLSRRESMLSSLEERGVLTDDLRRALEAARTPHELEDAYLPYRPRRVTRATKARDRGLEPLAERLLAEPGLDPETAARAFVNPDADVSTVEDALAGARDIVAERVSEERDTRSALRELFRRGALLQSTRSRKARENADAATYQDYFSWSEPASRAPSHRVLAMLRGEREGALVVHVTPPEQDALEALRRRWVSGSRRRAEQLDMAVTDCYKRLLMPSLESERKSELFLAASEAAAGVFASNLRDLLLAAPLGQRRVLAIDPGFRTGCKVVCLDEHGDLLCNETIYPLEPHSREADASARLASLVREHRIEVIAVGNGTGGRETMRFLASVEPALPPSISVNESGASVYSASDVARAEFPEHDVTVRGAISIGRRLMDPLAELVKIDPRSIGVGQYQHDVDAKLLSTRLDETVESCVNLVGADLNTASAHLLRHISGISERVASAIVEHRRRFGGFERRLDLLNVTGVGPRVFEQAAGFLRVHDGLEPLDATSVHPERYDLVRRIAGDLGVESRDLVGDEALATRVTLDRYVSADAGLPTLRDILAELQRPARDPRPEFEVVTFRDDVSSIDDLRVGMKLDGVVTNVTDFGAFVDIGVHRDGLVHVSKLAREFVRNPREVVRVGQGVTVMVTEIDVARGRISLSMAE
ncbi:MAG: Tex family protein [Spirochaetota bacterium]